MATDPTRKPGTVLERVREHGVILRDVQRTLTQNEQDSAFFSIAELRKIRESRAPTSERVASPPRPDETEMSYGGGSKR